MSDRRLTGLGLVVGLLIGAVCIYSGSQGASNKTAPPASGLYTGP